MRNLTLAIAVLLVCAASLALAGSQGTQPIEPPHDAQTAPGAPNPPKAENVPSVPKAPSATANITSNPPGHFVFNRVDGGFLRLDNQTGKIAFCSPQPIGWACQAVPEDRAALENEIARLQDEVANLKSELAALREPSPPRPPADLTPPAPLPDKSEDTTKLREDLARARAAFESAWRRLVEIIVQLQKDMMRKG
jgi:hypothetical protein